MFTTDVLGTNRIQGNLAFVLKLNQQKEELTAEELGQREYAKMILQIGSENVENTDQISYYDANPEIFSTTYKYRPTKVFVLEDKAPEEQWLEDCLKEFVKLQA
jgi:hypothetical protein